MIGILSAALLAVTGPQQAQGWRPVAAYDTGISAIELSSIRADGDTRSFSVSVIFPSVEEDSDMVVGRLSIDCRANKARVLSVEAYSPGGERLSSETVDGAWTSIIEGTPNSDYANALCRDTWRYDMVYATRSEFEQDARRFLADPVPA